MNVIRNNPQKNWFYFNSENILFSWDVDLCIENLIDMFNEIHEICNIRYKETGFLIDECLKILQSIIIIFNESESNKESRTSLNNLQGTFSIKIS